MAVVALVMSVVLIARPTPAASAGGGIVSINTILPDSTTKNFGLVASAGVSVTPATNALTIGNDMSVGFLLSAPEFSTSGSPLTGAGGTITVSKTTQTARTFWGGPTSGAAAVPTFRTITNGDIPSALSLSMLTVTGDTLLGSNTSCLMPILPSCYDISNQQCVGGPLGSNCLPSSATFNDLVVGTLTILNGTTSNGTSLNNTVLGNTSLNGTLTCVGSGSVSSTCLSLGGYSCPMGMPLGESCIPASLVQYDMSVTNNLTVNNVICAGSPLPSSCIPTLNASTITTGILPVSVGGTGSATALNNNRIMVSSGGAIVEAAALTNGQLLIGSTGAAPVAAAITAGSGITVTNGAGSITIAAAALNASTITTGTLSVSVGGTGSSTALNNNRIMVSSGGAIVEAAALTNGQLLIGSTSAAPVAATITAGTGITVTNGAGTITIAAAGGSSAVVMDNTASGNQYPTAPQTQGVWYGQGTKANTTDGTCVNIGNGAVAVATQSVAIGAMANSGLFAGPGGGVAIGYGTITGNRGVAVGWLSSAGNEGIGIGREAFGGGNAVGIGYQVSSAGDSSVAIGFQSSSSTGYGVAIGRGASTNSIQNAISFTALGGGAPIDTAHSFSLGINAASVTPGIFGLTVNGGGYQLPLYSSLYTTTVTSASPLALTVNSAKTQRFSGSTAQTLTLPVVTLLSNGFTFYIINDSSASITLQTSGAVTLATIGAGGAGVATVVDTTAGTGIASWHFGSDTAANTVSLDANASPPAPTIGDTKGVWYGLNTKANAFDSSCITIGSSADTNAANAIAIGTTSVASGASSIALGPSTTASSTRSVVIGASMTNSIADSVVVGTNAIIYARFEAPVIAVQSPSLTSTVVIDSTMGRVSLATALNGVTATRFTITNNRVRATSIITVSAVAIGGTGAPCTVGLIAITNGAFDVIVYNLDSTATLTSPIIHFKVLLPL